MPMASLLRSRQAVSHCSGSFFDYSDSPFDLGYMLFGTGKVDLGSFRFSFNQYLERSKLAIGMDGLQPETTVSVESIDFLARSKLSSHSDRY